MGLKLVNLTLLALLLLVQGTLWFGKAGVTYVMSLQSQLTEQLVTNDDARTRNARLGAEVSDLKEGLEMVEEKARSELGMVRPNEILVQVMLR